MKLTKLGLNPLDIKATDDCGNEVRGTRMINIVQKLFAGRYIEIAESGDSATISADISADYYDKTQINQIIADLDTVKFRVVATLPPLGVANVIYLVEKTAPDTGYNQYIWNDTESQFEPIGDTDIDLSDYYTKIQADTKFQEKIVDGAPILNLGDSTPISQVTTQGTTKKVSQLTAGTIWTYIQSKLASGNVYPVTHNTRISGVDTTSTPVVRSFSASDMWDYIASRLTIENVETVNNNTLISAVQATADVPVKQFTAEDLFNYMWKKIYPVGSVYITLSLENPATLFGGTWTKIEDRFLLATGSTYNVVNSTGGSTETTINRSDLPNVSITTSSNGSHKHNSKGYFGMTNGSGNKAMARVEQSGDPLDTNNPIQSAGSHTHSFDLNGNVTQTKLNNMPPYLTVNVWRRTA